MVATMATIICWMIACSLVKKLNKRYNDENWRNTGGPLEKRNRTTTKRTISRFHPRCYNKKESVITEEEEGILDYILSSTKVHRREVGGLALYIFQLLNTQPMASAYSI
jgi:hypothetical protein